MKESGAAILSYSTKETVSLPVPWTMEIVLHRPSSDLATTSILSEYLVPKSQQGMRTSTS